MTNTHAHARYSSPHQFDLILGGLGLIGEHQQVFPLPGERIHLLIIVNLAGPLILERKQRRRARAHAWQWRDRGRRLHDLECALNVGFLVHEAINVLKSVKCDRDEMEERYMVREKRKTHSS